MVYHIDNILWGETLVTRPLCNPPRGITIELPEGIDPIKWAEHVYGRGVKGCDVTSGAVIPSDNPKTGNE